MKKTEEKQNSKETSEETQQENKDIKDIYKEQEKERSKEEEEYKVKEKEEKNEQKDAQKIAELTEIVKRLQADFINYRNRVEKDTKVYIEYANAELIKKLLPVLDSFDMALKNTHDNEQFKKGMEMIYCQLLDILQQEGLKPIEALGKKFDPYLHEVLMKAESEKDDDIIIEEFQKGYMFKERVIRHSKVKISQKINIPKSE